MEGCCGSGLKLVKRSRKQFCAQLRTRLEALTAKANAMPRVKVLGPRRTRVMSLLMWVASAYDKRRFVNSFNIHRNIARVGYIFLIEKYGH